MGSPMPSALAETTSQARDFCTLTKGILALCEPYGPVHSFKLVHNRGAGRVAFAPSCAPEARIAAP
jgi:hypothetical protein